MSLTVEERLVALEKRVTELERTATKTVDIPVAAMKQEARNDITLKPDPKRSDDALIKDRFDQQSKNADTLSKK